MKTGRVLAATLILMAALLLAPGQALCSFMALDNGLILHSTGDRTLNFDFTILEENAGYESEFGYYDINRPNKLRTIFTFGNEVPDSVSMKFKEGDYAFYFKVNNENILVGTYGDLIDTDHLVWELADNTAYFYLDDSNRYADGDFNDMVVQGVAPAVPIPGAAWLLGSGLLGLVGFRAARSRR